jgi:hypothetical protein
MIRHSRALDAHIATLKEGDPIRKFVEDMDAVLLENMFAGDTVPKKRIPRYYLVEYGVNNLYRYRHPEGYRSAYTLVAVEGVGVCPIVLDINTHAEYERIFGYDM